MPTTTPRAPDFIATLSGPERAIHRELLRRSLEYRLALDQIKTAGGRQVIRQMLAACVRQNCLPNIEPVDLDDQTQRLAIYTADARDPLDLQIKPPANLAAYVDSEDGAKLSKASLARISPPILAFLQVKYCPPTHLAFRLEFSEILAEANHPAPLEIWLSTVRT